MQTMTATRVLTLAITGVFTGSIQGVPLDLADSPLFIGVTAKPNLLFLIDDSGSMDWEVVSKDADHGGRFTGTQPDGADADGAGSVKHRDADDDGEADCDFDDGSFHGYMYIVEFGSNNYGDGGNDCYTADDEAWRIRNHDFNPVYYNPARQYTPWAGLDADGETFADIDPTNAPNDPYDPTERIDLTKNNSNWSSGRRHTSDRDGDDEPDGFRYYMWQDDDRDGHFDNGEEFEVRIKDLPRNLAEGETKTIETAGGELTVHYPNSQTNFANWFAYYRSRDLIAKNAYSKVIAESDNIRMGLVTLHDNNRVDTRIRDMNANPSVGNKRDLLSELFQFEPDGGTPLRARMDDCGAYMRCGRNPFDFDESCPALLQGQGGNCQQNFLIMMTDGFYNKRFNGAGNNDGDNDSDWDGGAFADEYEDTLADIAMGYFEDDIHGDLDNDLVPSDADPATHQHIVNYSVAFGVDGTIDAMPEELADLFPWPDPAGSGAAKIDDLRHAAYNGRGLFLDASNPSKLEGALNAAVQDVESRSGSASALSINSGTLSTDSRIYQASFLGGSWVGDLASRPISDGSGNGTCTNEPVGDVCPPEWRARAVLSNVNAQFWDAGRTVVTKGDNGGIPFRYEELTSRQQNEISPAQLTYIRGKRDNEQQEGGDMRDRSALLGDIVHSNPVFVGPPSRVRYPEDWTDKLHDNANQPEDGVSYGNFRGTYKNRTPMAYVGANDGMLHGFKATNAASGGAEKLAYVPSTLIPALDQLTEPDYTHRYYVDGELVEGDAVLEPASGSPRWATVLIGTLAGGGHGIFALDITDPARFDRNEAYAARDTVLWEFDGADDPDLGLTFSQPVIVRLHDGHWYAVFGNGYNNTESRTAELFILDITTGDKRREIDTQAGPGGDNPGYTNGLSDVFPVDLDGDFITDYVYAGDLYGNIWKFDLTPTQPSQWTVAFTDESGEPAPLFNAGQPITGKPVVGAHPYGLEYGVMVYFGTGKYLEVSDARADPSVRHSVYGIWDLDVFTFDESLFSPEVTHGFGRERLATQAIEGEVRASGENFRVVSQNNVRYQDAPAGASDSDDGGGQRGWVLDLPAGSGEMITADPALRGRIVAVSTRVPGTNPCRVGGSGYFMTLDAATGGRAEFATLDVNDDRQFSDQDTVTAADADKTPSGIEVAGGAPGRAGFALSPGTDTDIAEVPVSDASIKRLDVNVGYLPEGRRSWRELRR